MLSSRSGVDAWTVRRGPWGVRPVLHRSPVGGSTEKLQGVSTAFLKIKKKEKLLSNISLLPILRPGNTGENQSDLCIQIVIFYNARVTLKFLL